MAEYLNQLKQTSWVPQDATFDHINVHPGAKAHVGHVFNFSADSPLRQLELYYAPEAPFNCYSSQHKSACLEGTRIEVLQEIFQWADDVNSPSILWLSGRAGTGKSTIARTVALYYSEPRQRRLAASFFFSRNGGDVSHARNFVSTIALQLATLTSELKRHISEAVSENPNVTSHTVRDQWNRLIAQPVSQLPAGATQRPLLILVDALDECKHDAEITAILQVLSEIQSSPLFHRIRVLLTSRPDLPIRPAFRRMPSTVYYDLALHEVSRETVNRDIRSFIVHEFEQIVKGSDNLPTGWPGEEKIAELVRLADGLFIFASTTCRFIAEEQHWSPQELLEAVFAPLTSFSVERDHGIPSGQSTRELDKMYTLVLERQFQRTTFHGDKSGVLKIFRRVMGLIAIAYEPLSVTAIAALLSLRVDIIETRLKHLHAVLDTPRDTTAVVKISHPSFREFLLDKRRCENQDFFIAEEELHGTLTDGCIRLLSALKQNICDQKSPGVSVNSLETNIIQQHIPAELQYAGVYWIQHLKKSGKRPLDNGPVYEFFQEHLLHWLEAMSWIGKLSEGIRAIQVLESMIHSNACPKLHAFVYDARRFAMYARPAIARYPLQTYISALVFAPSTSVVRNQFERHEMPQWIKLAPRIPHRWSPLLQTLQGHSRSVDSIVFSPDDRRLASASHDGTVRLWDTETGAPLSVLEHSESFASVAFSADSRLLVATWDGYFSSNRYSSPKTALHIWTADTGALLYTFDHPAPVRTVVFSPDVKWLASGSGWQYRDGDNTQNLRLWNVETGELQRVFEDGRVVETIVFSLDGKQLVSASGLSDSGWILWDAETGALLYRSEDFFPPSRGATTTIRFSPDGRQLAAGSQYGDVRLWNAETLELIYTLDGNMDEVNAIAFSPDSKWLASASSDMTVKMWDTSTGTLQHVLEDSTNGIQTVAFSMSGGQLASGSRDNVVRLWDTETGASLHELKHHSREIDTVIFSSDSRLLASASGDSTIRLWDAEMEAPPDTLDEHLREINVVAFSPDARQLAMGSEDHDVQLLDPYTGVCKLTLEGHSNSVFNVIFSPDGRLLASASADGTAILWDAETGILLHTLEDHPEAFILEFSPDSRRLASRTDDGVLMMVWDTRTGVTLDPLLPANIADLPNDTRTENHNIMGTFRRTYNRESDRITRKFHVEKEWISSATENLVWLPPEHRPFAWTSVGNMVALVLESGRLSLWRLEPLSASRKRSRSST